LWSVLLIVAFSPDPDRRLLPRVAPGLFWVAVLLAGLLALSRAFAVEGENGVRDALRLSGLDGAAVFCGKALAVAAQLLALEVILGIGVVVLYDLHLQNTLVVVVASLIATAGIAAAGTVYGVLAAGLRAAVGGDMRFWARRGTVVLGGLTVVSLAVLVVLGLFVSDPDFQQGDAVRLTYLRVPAAWIAYLAYGVTSLASALYLWRRTR